MFVFKAAVVGAGTMGGQIAQTIAAAGIPVVLKDIDDALVQAGIDEARRVTSGQVGKLAEKGKITAEQADEQIEAILGRIHGHHLLRRLRRRRLRDRGGSGADGDQAERLRRARRGHARPRDPRVEHLLAVDHRDRRSDACAPRRCVGFHYFYPASVMPLIEIVEGDETSAETVTAAVTFAQAIRKQPITLRRGARLRRQPHPELRHRRGLARAGGEGPVDQADRRGRRSRRRRAGRPLHARRTCSASTPCCTSPSTCVDVIRRGTLLRAEGDAEAGRRRQARRKTGGNGFYDPDGKPNLDGDAEPDIDGARGDAVAEDPARGVPRARGGRRQPPRHRLRDDGRRRPGPPPGASAAVHEGRCRGP